MTEQTSKIIGIDDAVRLVAAMLNNGEWEQAMSLSEKLCAAAPDHPDVSCVSAGLFWRVDKNDQAISMQKRLVALEPGTATHHGHISNCLHEMQKDKGYFGCRRA